MPSPRQTGKAPRQRQTTWRFVRQTGPANLAVGGGGRPFSRFDTCLIFPSFRCLESWCCSHALDVNIAPDKFSADVTCGGSHTCGTLRVCEATRANAARPRSALILSFSTARRLCSESEACSGVCPAIALLPVGHMSQRGHVYRRRGPVGAFSRARG